MFQPDGHLNAEMVSAWLDAPDDFREQDRLAIETHLAGCADCRAIATELTAIVRAFQALPLADPPRSFALTPEVAGLTPTPTLPASRQLEAPAHPHERRLERQARKPVGTPWYERQMSALRWATAVAAMLFFLVVSVDVLGNIDTSGDDDDMGVDADSSSEMAPMSGEGAAATQESASVMVATSEPDDTARNSDAPTPAGATDEEATGGGSEPQPTPASGAVEATAETTTGEEAEEEAADEAEEAPPPESAEVEPATATSGDDTMSTMLTPDDAEQPTQAEQDSGDVMMFSGEDTAAENGESNTLHLIELGLVILIAWLIVAMLALPRLRRPSA